MVDTSLLGGEGGGKKGIPPAPPKEMCWETPQGPSSGTSDMHNKNKMACCNTGGLHTAAEWDIDVWSSLFNLNNCNNMWQQQLQWLQTTSPGCSPALHWRTGFPLWPINQSLPHFIKTVMSLPGCLSGQPWLWSLLHSVEEGKRVRNDQNVHCTILRSCYCSENVKYNTAHQDACVFMD